MIATAAAITVMIGDGAEGDLQPDLDAELARASRN